MDEEKKPSHATVPLSLQKRNYRTKTVWWGFSVSSIYHISSTKSLKSENRPRDLLLRQAGIVIAYLATVSPVGHGTTIILVSRVLGVFRSNYTLSRGHHQNGFLQFKEPEENQKRAIREPEQNQNRTRTEPEQNQNRTITEPEQNQNRTRTEPEQNQNRTRTEPEQN